jgi:hypothetical protein
MTTLKIGDLKTGWLQQWGSLGAPLDSWQLRTYLLSANGWCRANGIFVDAFELAWFITPAPGARVRVEGATATSDMLESWRREMVLLREEAKRPVFKPGDHCTYCPALPFCPAYTGAVEKLHSAIKAGDPLGQIKAHVKTVERLVETTNKWIRGQVKTAGRIQGLKWVEVHLERLSREAAAELARLAPDAIKQVSYDAVEAVLGPQKTAELWNSFRARGLLSQVVSGQVHPDKNPK